MNNTPTNSNTNTNGNTPPANANSNTNANGGTEALKLMVGTCPSVGGNARRGYTVKIPLGDMLPPEQAQMVSEYPNLRGLVFDMACSAVEGGQYDRDTETCSIKMCTQNANSNVNPQQVNCASQMPLKVTDNETGEESVRSVEGCATTGKQRTEDLLGRLEDRAGDLHKANSADSGWCSVM